MAISINERIIQPRPSSIVAALYTLRDLDTDVAILHGPSGCCFKHSRLLEEDGMRVVTTAMCDSDYVFGGHDILVEVLEKVMDRFNPKTVGIVGTCASMIIGENFHRAVEEVNPGIPVIEVEIHAGFGDNTYGASVTLEAAHAVGLIDERELERQKEMLRLATELEKKFGAASKDYIEPSRGDLKYKVCGRLLELMGQGKKGISVLNAKKETAYMFADVNLAVSQAAKALGAPEPVTIANLDPNIGLPRIRRYASTITSQMADKGVGIDAITGGLDEYSITGERAADIIKEKYGDHDYVVLSGVPHAIPYDAIKGMEIFSITNGPRQVEPIRNIGHQHVTVEIDLHPKTLGVTGMVESEFGATLRSMLEDKR
ncbi:Ni-sirohydrochlorin a,c-diamide reductive cyclase catalytic subunit [Methanocella sp. CWC-04]|uniref:Ni-sirohydrochlorin a,c-diamide reductive cyclase catalytic subunit n=1 Tax=Methanooceanicella nereidis TaxID=2052831 RepID=A0AAP2W8F0_9EURY|nr:Ni-sirohydrochlorin a,c-diamide reductive cyclase catalytic subunit [Methanocella sp. CWC-04]MCD1295976.1 Ni-sirohydrochlorin a,c-diamide reductive cyclase catalytic subunit [Methanocella sp. CWC-04]